jgi:hypothetical protein
MSRHYVTRNKTSVLGWNKLSSLIHASDLVDGHILPHTTQDSCNKPKPSTQHSPARGQYTSKTSGQIDRQKKETEAYTESRYHGTRGKIFLSSQSHCKAPSKTKECSSSQKRGILEFPIVITVTFITATRFNTVVVKLFIQT